MNSEDKKRTFGRQTAVQTLLDLHKHGSAYRVAKIMEEGPMEALSARSINVTRAILEEKAWGLSKYENKGSYLDCSPFCDTSQGNSTPKGNLKESVESNVLQGSRIRNLVCKHHSKIVQSKVNKAQSKPFPQEETPGTSNTFIAGPSPQLVSALRKVYGTQTTKASMEQNESDDRINSSAGNILPALLQDIFEHCIFSCEDGNVARIISDDSEEISSSQRSEKLSSANIETIIGNACSSDCNDVDSLQGLLIASMSVLVTSLIPEWVEEDSSLQHSTSLTFDADQPECGMQVSGPLSFVCEEIYDWKLLDELGGRKYIPDQSLMEYFKNASAVYEERLDIQKTRNITQQPIEDAHDELESLQERAHSTECDASDSNSSYSSDESMPMYHSISTTENQNDSREDGDFGESEHRRPQSNLSSVHGNERVSSLLDEQDPGDEGQLLQDALAFSLADINSAIDDIVNDSEELDNPNTRTCDEGLGEPNEQNISPEIEGDIPGAGTKDANNLGEVLPSFPAAPDDKLLRDIWTSSSQSNVMPNRTKILDPSALSEFGKLPAANTFIILLSVLVRRMETKLASYKVGTASSQPNLNTKENRSNSHQPFDTSSMADISGRRVLEGKNKEKHDGNFLHLAVACLFIMSDARLLCFKYLCEESDSTLEHPVDINDETNASKDEYYNTDDPAGLITDLLSDDDIRVSSECLEEKGLIRKAAASAHFAALRKEKSCRRIESLIELMHVLSIGSFLVLRCLRLLLQEFSFQNCADLYQSRLLSITAQLRLTTSLSSFTSSSLRHQHYERLNISPLLIFRGKIFDSLRENSLLLEATSLWGESILFVTQSTNQVDQMIKCLVDTIMSKVGVVSTRMLEGKLNLSHGFDSKWSAKDESVLKLNSLCRRLQCSDALNVLVPRPTVDATSEIGVPFPSPTSILCCFQLVLFEAVDTINMFSQSVTDCYLAICHRMNINFLQWGGTSDNNGIHIYNHKLDCSVDGSGLLIGDDPLLTFDKLKCSETIAIVSDTLSELSPQVAVQRAHRVWGTVFGKKSFKPKSGIYRWAVHMKACEKGHIFIGVVTAKASTKTYVGGDKFGWGMIGTKALWHDRKKVNTNYGKTIRSGDTVVLTLDTDSGTLKYSLWKKHDKPTISKYGPSDSDDATFINGSLEDWGIAFEGLPLDASLYPAVGMYQRDDKATLIAIGKSESQSHENDRVMSRRFFPDSEENLTVRNWNEQICSEGIKYICFIIDFFSRHLSDGEVARKDLVLGDVLPCLFASISMVPSSIPILSGRFSYNLLPVLLRFLAVLESNIEDDCKILNPFQRMRNGVWSITYDAPEAHGNNCTDENSGYLDKNHHVDVEFKISSKDIGDYCEIFSINKKSTDITSQKGHVVCGSSIGNLIHLIEYLPDSNKDLSRRFIEARMNFDGTRFEGTYRNFRDGSTGTVSALNISDMKDFDFNSSSTSLKVWRCQSSFLLGTAIEHLLLILSEGAPSRDVYSKRYLEHNDLSRLSKVLSSSIILKEGFKENDTSCKFCLDRIRDLFEMPHYKFDAKVGTLISSWYRGCEIMVISSQVCHEDNDCDDIAPVAFDIIDEKISKLVGGTGSLSTLHSAYNIARKGILRVLLYHTGCMDLLSKGQNEIDQVLVKIWRCAVNVMEAGVRSALAKAVSKNSLTLLYKDYCHLLQQISSFLLQIKSPRCQIDVCLSELKDVYLSISSEDEIFEVREMMIRKSTNAALKCICLEAIHGCIRMPSCSFGTYGCMVRGFCRIAIPEETPDTSLGYGTCHFVPGASAMIQNFAIGIQNKIFMTISSFLRSKMILDQSKTVFSSTQSLLLSVISCLFTCGMISENLQADLVQNLNENSPSHSIPYLDGCSLLNFNLERSVTDVSSTFTIKYSIWRSNAVILLFLSRVLHCKIFQHIDGKTEISNYLRILKTRLQDILANFTDRYCSSAKDYSDVWKDFETWNTTETNLRITELRDIQMHREHCNKLRITLPYDERMEFSFEMNYLDSLLSSLFTATRSHESSQVVLDDIPFVRAILRFLGESADKNIDIFPYLRIRLVRLLRFIVPYLEPDDNFLSLIFTHLGKIQSGPNGNPAEHVEAKEVVTLLRCLCSSSRWSDFIVSFISKSLSMTSDLLMPLVSVFGGLPGFLSDASFVLMKPAHNLPPSTPADFHRGKGKASLSATGKGVEGIISGLCRINTVPGIISSCDEANSTCEIVLIERDCYAENAKDDDHKSWSKVSVRFAKVPFSDIVPTDEFGLLLDDALTIRFLSCYDLNDAISSFLKEINTPLSSDISTNPGKNENLGFSDIAKLLRSYITILSIPNPCCQFNQELSLEGVLSGLLKVASITSVKSRYATSNIASNSSLKYLPELEDRYWRLQFLKSRVSKRQNAILTSSAEVIKLLESEYDETCTRYVAEKPMMSSMSSEGPIQMTTNTERRQTASSNDEYSFNSNEDTNHLQDDESDGQDDETEENAESEQLREVAVIQMMELGLPRSWAEYALQQVGGTNIEAAVHFCLERGSELERLVAEQQEQISSSRRISRRTEPGINHLLQQLIEMGFPSHWCSEALAATGQNVDDALTWILTNGERLSTLDEQGHNEEDSESDDDASASEVEDDDCETSDGSQSNLNPTTGLPTIEDDSQMWSNAIICPVQPIAGKSKVDARTLEINGVSSGGFTSVGTNGVLLSKGKWYYECVLLTAGCIQIGWADSSFSSHCYADRGDGCGDGPSSWAYDGWRRYRWHTHATEWGCRWHVGDVVGCLLDMDQMEISFTLNGKGEEIGMGLAFSGDGFKPCGGVYACVSFNRKEKVRLLLGGSGKSSFINPPPHGYRPVGEAVVVAARELGCLLKEEMILNGVQLSLDRKSFLCDFSGSDHGYEIFAWQHRYYGSDASVHLSIAPRGQILSSNERIPFQLVSKDGGRMNYDGTIDHMLSKLMTKCSIEHELQNSSMGQKLHFASNEILKSYETILEDIDEELQDVSLALCILYARKAILHFAITTSNTFDLSPFYSEHGDEVKAAKDFLTVIELCCSLQDEGWGGEAGAMSLASEALGLAISTKTGCNASNLNVSTVMLNSVFRNSRDSCVDPLNSISACAEYQLAVGGLGAAFFLRNALKSAMVSSKNMIDVMLSFIRRSIRLIAGVNALDESSSDVTLSKKDDSSNATNNNEQYEVMKRREADARLICFFTGLLITNLHADPSNDCEAKHRIMCSLFEAWSLGLLSRSVPWRMVSAMTVSSLLSSWPESCSFCLPTLTPIQRFYETLESYVSRRMWAERAALPVCSRYLQSLIELFSNVYSFPSLRGRLSTNFRVDASTPCVTHFNGLTSSHMQVLDNYWESDEGWICSDNSWEIWVGTVEYFSVDWTFPGRCSVRSLMDGGEGPPMLREGHKVLRGVDWNTDGSGCINGKEDGKDIYDLEKAKREDQKKLIMSLPEDKSNDAQISESPNAVDSNFRISSENPKQDSPLREKKKLSQPKLPLGTVIGIESWNGVPGVARRIHWDLTGEESVYRYGGDGGRFDIVHVEVNEKNTRVIKRYPYSETSEQCAVRHGFGTSKKYNVILRIRKSDMKAERFGEEEEWKCSGILEWPDFGAGCLVTCRFHDDDAVTIQEDSIIYGSKDHGWEPRFGEPSYVPGTTYILSKANVFGNDFMKEDGIYDEDINDISDYEELLGSTSYVVQSIRNPENGEKVRVVSEMRLIRSKTRTTELEEKVASQAPPIAFDEDWHAASLSVSRDRKSVTCTTAEGRSSAFLSIGFSKGIHYWEIKIEQADVGSVFIGVAEKPKTQVGANDARAKLNRWYGWGFVNFRATYHEGTERVYGSHCHAGDTVGVLLDCDSGRLSFFYDGVKYGEHILNDLGCAFENLSPFGFNSHGCGGGGAGQGAPSGDGSRGGRYQANGNVRPKTLWPIIGLRHPGDRVTLSRKWMTNYGVDGRTIVRNAVLVDEVLRSYDVDSRSSRDIQSNAKNSDFSEHVKMKFPDWLLKESFIELKRWEQGRCNSVITRAAGPFILPTACLNIDVDPSPMSCATACARIGLQFVLLPGDKVTVKRSAGRILESPEEALVLGAFQGRLWYRIVSQKSDGGSLTEGGERAWFWDESEVADDGIQPLKPTLANSITLPLLDRFKCASSGGLKITYSHGALIRSDIEISDLYSKTLGTIPMSTVIPCEDVLERRMNSNGVVRFLVNYPPIGRGWISSRIRGGSEELIVELIGQKKSDFMKVHKSPKDCAAIWMAEFRKQKSAASSEKELEGLVIKTYEEFEKVVNDGIIVGMNNVDSDSYIAELVTAVTDSTTEGSALDCPYDFFCSSIYQALQMHNKLNDEDKRFAFQFTSSNCNYSVASKIASVNSLFPTMKSIVARSAMIRAFNRRCKFALPLFALRPSQENSAVLGGYVGLGASLQRSGQCRKTDLFQHWIQAKGIGARVRAFRKLIFTSVKIDFFKSVVEATTTPTPLSHDEYELPRDIRTVRVNRLKARKELEKETSEIERERTTFGQLRTELNGWSGNALRRSYVAKGHGGQPRAFKVKLIGEGVNDYSGPYREVFTDAFREVNYVGPSMISVLGILQPSPNKYFGVGESRNLNIFCCGDLCGDGTSFTNATTSGEENMLKLHFSSLIPSKSENDRDLKDCLEFLGRLVSTAVRHGIPVDLDLPLGTVWKQLCEEDVSDEEILKEIDVIAYNRLQKSGISPFEDVSCFNLLTNQRKMFNAFAEGISSVLPIEIFSVFTGEELRDFFCGDNDVDVELLKKVAEYEGYNEDDAVIKNFWEVLREMTTDERKLFLQFVWARTRMPFKQSDFDAPFKIQKDTKSSSSNALPSASTCFFTLMLPEYDDKDTLRDKLLFAINNVKTMESDYVTNDAEVSEGWRDV